MKIKQTLLPIALTAIAATMLTGCKTGKAVKPGGEGTIQIRAYKGGYGQETKTETRLISCLRFFLLSFREKIRNLDKNHKIVSLQGRFPEHNRHPFAIFT